MEFLILFEFVFFAIIFALMTYFMSFILRYKSQNKELNSTYECGMCPNGDSKIQLKPKFLIYAMLFLLFEAECILIFPYALVSRQLGLFGVFSVMIFILILIFALFYALRAGFLRLM